MDLVDRTIHLLLLPGQFVRNEVAVRRIHSRILVHTAHEPLFATFFDESKLLKYIFKSVNYRSIIFIVVS